MTSAAPPDMSRFLKRLLLRSVLSDIEQEAILDLQGRFHRVHAHTDIVLPGQTIDFACLILEGWLGRFDQMRDGGRQTTAFHIPGDMCDLHSVVAPTTGWGITALSTATILRIPHASLRALALAYPQIAMAFWRDTATDASLLAKWIANVGRKDARARVAHLLCEMGWRMELAGLGTRTSFQFDATQEQIADAMGLTPVHVNRMLQALRAEGVLTMRSSAVDIHDWDQLADIAEFEPTFLLLNEVPPTQWAGITP
jgi:CRP-like cAMP-binding protein